MFYFMVYVELIGLLVSAQPPVIMLSCYFAFLLSSQGKETHRYRVKLAASLLLERKYLFFGVPEYIWMYKFW